MKLFIIDTVKGEKYIVMAENMMDAKRVLVKESSVFNPVFDDIKSVLPYSESSIRIY